MDYTEKKKYIRNWLEGASERWINIVYSLLSNAKEPGK